MLDEEAVEFYAEVGAGGAGLRTEAFIDGRFVAAADGRTFEDVSPRDGSVLAAVARGSGEDIDRAVRAARRSFDDGGWALADPRERKRVLLRLAELIDEHARGAGAAGVARRRPPDQRRA